MGCIDFGRKSFDVCAFLEGFHWFVWDLEGITLIPIGSAVTTLGVLEQGESRTPITTRPLLTEG